MQHERSLIHPPDPPHPEDTRPGDVVVVVIGGDPLRPDAAARIPRGATVIAADSGLDRALAAGLSPTLLVGDLDSVSARGLAWARERDLATQLHPCDKDATDAELALAAALSMRTEDAPLDVVLLSGGGGRLDHSMAAITALGRPQLAVCRSVSALWGASEVHVLHGPRCREVAADVGVTFSLLALHGSCTGVDVVGARWPLGGASIMPGTGVGVSNVVVSTPLTVSVTAGVLTVIVEPTA